MTNFIYLLFACSDKSDTTTNEEEIIEEEITYETGCFVVNNNQGYASLNDAIQVANEGDEITMSTCSGAHEETIIIDKSISIIGNGLVSDLEFPPILSISSFRMFPDELLLDRISSFKAPIIPRVPMHEILQSFNSSPR